MNMGEVSNNTFASALNSTTEKNERRANGHRPPGIQA